MKFCKETKTFIVVDIWLNSLKISLKDVKRPSMYCSHNQIISTIVNKIVNTQIFPDRTFIPKSNPHNMDIISETKMG